MKDKTIKAMAERVGQTRAEKFWALFVERLCDGIEPEDGDTFKREDIEKRFENNPVARDAFIAVLCSEQKPETKGRKFKADNPRKHTAVEIVAFIAANPKIEGLRAEYMRRTGGEPALFYVDGKLCEAESADRIQRLFERDPVAPFVLIGGREVTPVGYPDDAAKEDREDPYQRGVALGQPGDVSERLGVSLTGISDETRQAIACAVEHDLSDSTRRDLQSDAEAAKGKTVKEYLADKPLARRAWPTWPKPKLVLKRQPKAPVPFVEPSAPTAPRGRVDVLVRPKGWTPTLCFLGADADREAWQSLYTHLAPLEAVGMLRITSDSHVPPGANRENTIAGYLAKADAVMCVVTPESNRHGAREETLRWEGPKVPVLLGLIAGYDLLWGDLQPLPVSGKAARSSDERAGLAMEIAEYAARLQPRALQRALRPVYDHDRVHAAILSAGLAGQRAALLDGIDRRFTASLVTNTLPAAQVSLDLSGLKGVCLTDGSRPMLTYLSNALRLAGGRAQESAVLREAIAALT